MPQSDQEFQKGQWQMRRITKGRGYTHCRRQDRVKDNCKYLLKTDEWKVVKAGWDRGAFKEVGYTIYSTMDGSSRMAEWISNLNFGSIEGFHGGFFRAAVKAYNDIKKKLKHPIAYYREWCGDGHSRGGLEKILMFFFWAEKAGLKWDMETGVGFLDAVRNYAIHFDDDYSDWPQLNIFVGSGVPVDMTLEMKVLVDSFERPPVEIHYLITEKDFVPKVNAPKRGLFSRLLKDYRLYHANGELYKLPTVPGKIDHLGYSEAISGSDKKIWGDWK